MRRSAAEFDDDYVDHGFDGSSSDAEVSLANAPRTPSDIGMDPECKLEEQDGKPSALRRRTKINYAVPPSLGELKPPPPPRNRKVGGKRRGSEWSASGGQTERVMGIPLSSDDSVGGRTHWLCTVDS
ncbi:hypothetical protein EDC04DRAFT_3146322 [Pisolithus marmoratus]|nr:hypothetical protein EDC04DRAFT_3146322 [Pisolithus marmoratus]